MKHQIKPEPEEKTIDPVSESYLAAYGQDLSHSSQRAFFRYSAIETEPVCYELTQSFAYTTYAFPFHIEPIETSLTIEEPYFYLGETQKSSASTGKPNPETRKKNAVKK